MITLPLSPARAIASPRVARPSSGTPDVRPPARQVPHRRGRHWLARPALAGRIAASFAEHRLVLLQAAAGHGKTCALAEAVQHLPPDTALAWVDIHPGDDLPAVLRALLDALSTCAMPWPLPRTSLLALAAADESLSRQRAAVALVQALAACPAATGVIVLDALDRVDDGPLFEFIDLLLSRMDPRWTLAISTRHEPPLSLARLRAWGEVALFRADDLRFEAAESLALAARAGFDPARALALHERSRGWAAGLQLGLAEGGEPTIVEYLHSEVIATLDASLRRFLLQVSVLSELTTEHCAALTGHAHAGVLLEAVARLDLFVEPGLVGRSALRLQPLFRSALQQQMQREQPQAWRELQALAQALQPIEALAPAASHAPPTAAVAEAAASEAPAAAVPVAESLSPREAEVLARLAAGESNKAIARALDLSPHTVKRHVANILGKLGASSRVQAAAWAHRIG